MKPITKTLVKKTSRLAGKKAGPARSKELNHVDLLRMRVEAAEATWREAKEQASKAKRRRKLAKLLAKRAKKDARTAKMGLDELRQALSLAEARVARTTAHNASARIARAGKISRPVEARQQKPAKAKSGRAPKRAEVKIPALLAPPLASDNAAEDSLVAENPPKPVSNLSIPNKES